VAYSYGQPAVAPPWPTDAQLSGRAFRRDATSLPVMGRAHFQAVLVGAERWDLVALHMRSLRLSRPTWRAALGRLEGKRRPAPT